MATLFDATELAGMRLKNRLFRSATWVGLCGADGTPTERVYEIYEELAAGGVAAICTEFTDVCPNSSPHGNNMRLDDDALVGAYRRLTSIAHAHDARMIAQLNIDAYVREDGSVAEVDEMGEDDIARVRRLFVEGARRAREAGFDAVQVHLAYGWLLSRFLMPQANHRADAYGGGIEGRSRLAREVVRDVRAALPGYPVCAKVSFWAKPGDHEADPRLGFPYALDEAAEACRLLSESGLDFVEVVGSASVHGRRWAALRHLLPRPRGRREGPHGHPHSAHGRQPQRRRHGGGAERSRRRVSGALAAARARAGHRRSLGASGDTAPSRCRLCDGCYRTEGKRCLFVLRGEKA